MNTPAAPGAALAPAEAPSRAAVAQRWDERLSEHLGTYLPLLVMALLALGSWWLVKNSPLLDNGRPPAPPRHVPDYTMNGFMVQRFGPAGALRGQIEGDVLRHYPDTDTLEIDNPRLRAVGEDGSVMHATAKRALSNADGSEVQLFEDAHVVRDATPTEEAIDFRGEFLHAFLATERVRSHLPVRVRQGTTEIRADAMDYDNLRRIVDLKGRTRAVFPPGPARPPVSGAAAGKTGPR